MSERCAMSLMRVRGVLAVNSAVKDGSLQDVPCSRQGAPDVASGTQYVKQHLCSGNTISSAEDEGSWMKGGVPDAIY